MKKYSRQSIILAIQILLFFITSKLPASDRIYLPGDVYYHRFASSVCNPEAIWINPAGLGIERKLNLQYMVTYHSGDFTGDWGIAMTGDGIGMAYRKVEDYLGVGYSEFLYGVGTGIGQYLYMGGSYRYVKAGFDYYHKRHFWNIGILYRSSARINLAALFSNLNQGKVNNLRSDAEELYSASYQSKNGKLTLSVEMTLSSGQNLSYAKYNYGIDFMIKPKWTIFANINNDQFYQIGLKYNFGDYFVGGQGRADSDNHHLGTTVYTGYIKSLGPR
jgi:hypothetical protein